MVSDVFLNWLNIFNNDFVCFGIDDGCDQQLLSRFGVFDHLLHLLHFGFVVVFADQHFLHFHFLLGNVFAHSHFLRDLLDGVLDLSGHFGRVVADNCELLFWHEVFRVFGVFVTDLDGLLLDDRLNSHDVSVMADFVVDDRHFFSFGFFLADFGFERDNVFGLLVVVGHLDIDGSAFLQLGDFSLDAVDDFLRGFVLLDDFLDVIGRDQGLARDCDFGFGVGFLDFLQSALFDDLVLASSRAADEEPVQEPFFVDDVGDSQIVAELDGFFGLGFETCVVVVLGSDGVEGGFGVETQPHGRGFGDDVLLGHGLLFGETELAEETETVVVGETRSESEDVNRAGDFEDEDVVGCVAELLSDDGEWVVVFEDLDFVAAEVVAELGLDALGHEGDRFAVAFADCARAFGFLAFDRGLSDFDGLELLVNFFWSHLAHLDCLHLFFSNNFNLFDFFFQINMFVNLFHLLDLINNHFKFVYKLYLFLDLISYYF